jgi:hypothetical protein
MKTVLILVALVLALPTGTAGAQDAEVQATLETEPFFDNDLDDADAETPRSGCIPRTGRRASLSER